MRLERVGVVSFVSQINSQSNGKFSYCLPIDNKYMPWWFGSDAVATAKFMYYTIAALLSAQTLPFGAPEN